MGDHGATKGSRWDPPRQSGGEEAGDPRLELLLWCLQEGTGGPGKLRTNRLL